VGDGREGMEFSDGGFGMMDIEVGKRGCARATVKSVSR